MTIHIQVNILEPSYNDNMLIQDMSIEQWDNLLPIDSSMDMSEILGTTYDVKLKDEVIH